MPDNATPHSAAVDALCSALYHVLEDWRFMSDPYGPMLAEQIITKLEESGFDVQQFGPAKGEERGGV